MNEYTERLHGDYLKIYHQLEMISENFSFFLNDDDYFKISMLNDALDLLLEAESHHKDVKLIFGDDLSQYVYERYKECMTHQFSYSIMAISFVIILMIMNSMFPNLFSFHYLETEYYIFFCFLLSLKDYTGSIIFFVFISYLN